MISIPITDAMNEQANTSYDAHVILYHSIRLNLPEHVIRMFF